jgi:hypothetical protein
MSLTSTLDAVSGYERLSLPPHSERAHPWCVPLASLRHYVRLPNDDARQHAPVAPTPGATPPRDLRASTHGASPEIAPRTVSRVCVPCEMRTVRFASLTRSRFEAFSV